MLKGIIVYLLYLAATKFSGTVQIRFTEGRWVSVRREERANPR